MEKSEDFKMVYRYLGNTGLKVSALSYGTMLSKYTEENEKAWIECADYAYKRGLNLFDSSESYGNGKGDEMLGRAIKECKWRREDIVVTVKVFHGKLGEATINQKGLSRKKIIESTLASLKRMGLDYCDLVFAHAYEYVTPLEETCRAFNWLIKKGYATYWATSNWPADMIVEAIHICDENGWHRPVADQCQYNCLVRENLESNNNRLFEKYGYGTTVWSPLTAGILTGKYNDGNIPDNSRFQESAFMKDFFWEKYFGEANIESTKKLLTSMKELADELGVTQAQLALAWVLVNKDVSTCIIGASKLSQMESNLKALELAAKWTKETEEKMEKLLGNTPPGDMNWLKWSPSGSRRAERLDIGMQLGKIEFKPGEHNSLC